MIFATVGTQLPFRRFIDALDRIAGRHKLDIVAQTCDPGFEPQHIRAFSRLDAATFDRYVAGASIIVGHAGIDTILKAFHAEKPLVLFPRRAGLGEHRNDDQLATVAAFRNRTGFHVAGDAAALESLLTGEALLPVQSAESATRPALIDTLRRFIHA